MRKMCIRDRFTAQFQTRDNDKPQNTWLLQIRSEADKRELKLEIAKTEGDVYKRQELYKIL